MNRVLRSSALGLALVAIAVAGSCSSDPHPGDTPPGSTSPGATSPGPLRPPPSTSAADSGPTPATGPTSEVRFVILTPPGSEPIDVFAGSTPGGSRLASGLTAGTVTEYLASGAGGITVATSDGSVVSTFDVDHVDHQRSTVIIGAPDGNQFAADTLAEADGRVVDDTGNARRDGTAFLVTGGYGLAEADDGSTTDVRLGTAAGKCLTAEGDETDDEGNVTDPNDGGTSVGPQTSEFGYDVAAGSTDLVLLTDVGCRTVETAPVHAALHADTDAYVLPWMASADHMHMLFVPVSADGSGTAGVIDSGDGPTFSPENDQTVIDTAVTEEPDDTDATITSG